MAHSSRSHYHERDWEIPMAVTDIQYISDEGGNTTAVIVPIELWREIASERETAYLLSSETMKQRLLEARQRQDGIPLDEVRKKLGV
jgi:PHD/YefM family antitoxin component YafN of YafNO toxin-antitoxin module